MAKTSGVKDEATRCLCRLTLKLVIFEGTQLTANDLPGDAHYWDSAILVDCNNDSNTDSVKLVMDLFLSNSVKGCF